MPRSQRKLSGKVAIVTGGARGIGRAIAAAMLTQGMRVGIGDLDGEIAERTASELGNHAHGYLLDVTDLESFERFLSSVETDLGPPDVWVNNAGIALLGPFADETADSTERQISVNVYGLVNGCRLAIPRLAGRSEAHMINLASVAGKGTYPGMVTYCGTKHFVVGFSEGLRGELRRLGIEVSCVMPGIVNTELAAGMGKAAGFKKLEPTDVAGAVIATLRRPRFEVFVPRSVGLMMRAMVLMPRGVRDIAVRLTGADRLALEPDWTARADYEQRARGKASPESPQVAAGKGSSAASTAQRSKQPA